MLHLLLTAVLAALPGATQDMPPAAPTAPLSGSLVGICDDVAEWPPYTYYHRENGRKTGEVRGNSLRVVEAIFARHGIRYEIQLLPWRRCLLEVAGGTRFQMLLSATSNPNRRPRGMEAATIRLRLGALGLSGTAAGLMMRLSGVAIASWSWD